MLRLITAVLLVLLATPAFAAIVPKSDEQKTLYAIGALQGRGLSVFNLAPTEFEIVRQGFADSGRGRKLLVNPEAHARKIKALAQTRQAVKEAKHAAEEKAPVSGTIIPKTDKQKTLYAIGALQGRDLSEFSLSSSEFEMVQQGFADSASGRKPIINIDAYIGNIKALAKTRQAAAETKYAAAEKEFYNKVAAEKGTVKTESGLLYQSLREGSGASPTALNRVKVHYRTTLVNKKEINNTYKLKTPAVLRMNYVDRCFSEGVQLMKVGGKARLICPPELLFKSKVRDSGVPPNSFEVYDVELLDVLK